MIQSEIVGREPTLWRLAIERAEDRSATVLSCRPVEAEAKLAFASLADQALFMSPKTVEANLTRVYGKLAIRSRAELGALMFERRAGKVSAKK